MLGHSGGGPYAAACALKCPERLTAVGIVSGTGSFDEPGLTSGVNPNNLRFFELSRTKPPLSRLAHRGLGITARYAPGRLLAQVLAALPEPDQAAILARSRFQQAFVGTLLEALRSGPRGVQLDTAIMMSPWGFRPSSIVVPVHLWHGGRDRNASPAMGYYLAELCLTANLCFIQLRVIFR